MIKQFFLFLMMVLVCMPSSAQRKNQPKNDLDKMRLKGRIKSMIEKRYEAGLRDGQWILNELFSTDIYQFDKNGNYKESSMEFASGGFYIRYVYEYDSKGHRTKQHNYNKKNVLTDYMVYTHDKTGRETGGSNWSPGGDTLYSTWTNTYDEKGRLIKIVGRDSLDHKTTYSYYTYDANGNTTEYITQTDQFKDINTCIYDRNNELVEETWYWTFDDLSTTTKHEIQERDKQGNWISKALISDGPDYFVQRSIEYY